MVRDVLQGRPASLFDTGKLLATGHCYLEAGSRPWAAPVKMDLSTQQQADHAGLQENLQM